MRKAWVIVRGFGEYSDRYETPIRAFLNLEAAQSAMKQLEAIENRNKPSTPIELDAWRKYWVEATLREMAYSALGYGDIPGDSDWRLEEVDLVET